MGEASHTRRVEVIVEAEGYEPQAKLVEVSDPTHGPAQRLDFDLAPIQVEEEDGGEWSFDPADYQQLMEQQLDPIIPNYLEYKDYKEDYYPEAYEGKNKANASNQGFI